MRRDSMGFFMDWLGPSSPTASHVSEDPLEQVRPHLVCHLVWRVSHAQIAVSPVFDLYHNYYGYIITFSTFRSLVFTKLILNYWLYFVKIWLMFLCFFMFFIKVKKDMFFMFFICKLMFLTSMVQIGDLNLTLTIPNPNPSRSEPINFSFNSLLSFRSPIWTYNYPSTICIGVARGGAGGVGWRPALPPLHVAADALFLCGSWAPCFVMSHT